MLLPLARPCSDRSWRTTKGFLLIASVSLTLSAAFCTNPGMQRLHRFSLQVRQATNTPSIIDDEHDDDYSRSLSPRQERTQVLKEYTALYDEGPRWRRRFLRPFQSTLRRLFPKHINKPGTLILIKSGESTWKKKGIFTGWANEAKLTPQGEQECRHAARLLLAAGCFPDLVATSMLSRAIDSAWVITKEMDSIFLPVYKSWRLNERMYGSLQGIPKKNASLKFGQDVVQAWYVSCTVKTLLGISWAHPVITCFKMSLILIQITILPCFI
jgi:Histidine phosphatase superfamily (branch 1)